MNYRIKHLPLLQTLSMEYELTYFQYDVKRLSGTSKKETDGGN